MRHGDPSLVYRWPREDVIAARALEMANALDANDATLRAGKLAGAPARPAAAFLSHPNVTATSAEAARFWSTP